MPDFLQQLMKQLKTIWAELSASQRMIILTVLVGVISLMGGAIYYGSQPHMVPLAWDLGKADLTKVDKIIQEEGVEYEYDGNTILVPRKKIGQLKMRLDKEGVDPAKTGDDGLGPANPMDPDEVLKVKLFEHKLHRLERHLVKLDFVENASVTATNAPRRLLQRNESKARASVIIDTVQGRVPNAVQRKQLLGIVLGHFQALEEENIHISFNGTGGSTAVDPFEDRMQKELQRFFDYGRGVGMTKVIVSVNRDMSRRRTKTTTPSKGTKIRSKSKTEETPILSSSPSGDPSVKQSLSSGTQNNTPDTKVVAEIPKGIKSETEEEFIPGSSVIEEYHDAGEVSMVNASIVVSEDLVERIGELKGFLQDLKAAETPEEKKIIETAKPQLMGLTLQGLRTESSVKDEFASLQNEIKEAAISFLGIKKDGTVGGGFPGTVSVNFSPTMNQPSSFQVLPGPGMMSRENIELGVQILGAIVVLLFLKRLLGKSTNVQVEEAETTEEPEAANSEPDPLIERKRLRREIEKTVAGDPGAVGRILAGWIQEK